MLKIILIFFLILKKNIFLQYFIFYYVYFIKTIIFESFIILPLIHLCRIYKKLVSKKINKNKYFQKLNNINSTKRY